MDRMMVDPAVKTAMVVCLVLTGFCAAVMFRGDRPKPASSEPTAEPLRIRSRAAMPMPRADGRRDLPIGAGDARDAAVIVPVERREAAPRLVRETPPAARQPLQNSPERAACVHRIVDGDTLPKLAQRYLGAASRANEIFQANRDVLSDSELLPIGVDLRIPPREKHAVSESPSHPLVPVPRF